MNPCKKKVEAQGGTKWKYLSPLFMKLGLAAQKLFQLNQIVKNKSKCH